MPDGLIELQRGLPVFMLVVARLAGMLMFQPFLGALSIPPPARVLLVCGLAALVTPLTAPPAQLPDSPAAVAGALAMELMLGVLVGLVMRMAFFALELAGLLVAQESGMAFAQIADPTTGGQQDVLSTFYVQVGLMVALAAGVHRAIVTAVLDSLTTLPLLSVQRIDELGVEGLLDALRAGADAGLRIAAPILISLFLVNVALGFIGRSAPQIQVTPLGFALKGVIVFGLLASTLPVLAEVFTATADELVDDVRELISSAAERGVGDGG